MNRNDYDIIDHTADMGIEVKGRTLSDLFVNAGLALFDLIGVTKASTEEESLPICVSGEDDADLLVNWLRELLYLFNGEELLVNSIAISSIKKLTLTAQVGVISHDSDKFEINYEIKAVTYHKACVKQLPTGYVARVIFDL